MGSTEDFVLIYNKNLPHFYYFLAIGNPRGHENSFLLAFGILWFRWHNYEASRVMRENPTLDPVRDDEKIFNLARKRVIALYQVIINIIII